MASWLLASTPTLAYSLTHSTQHSVLNATTLSTTSYPCALTMVVLSCVPMCPGVRGYVYLSVGLCVAVSASVTGCSRLQYLLVLLRSMPGDIHDPTYPEILWHLHK